MKVQDIYIKHSVSDGDLPIGKVIAIGSMGKVLLGELSHRNDDVVCNGYFDVLYNVTYWLEPLSNMVVMSEADVLKDRLNSEKLLLERIFEYAKNTEHKSLLLDFIKRLYNEINI